MHVNDYNEMYHDGGMIALESKLHLTLHLYK